MKELDITNIKKIQLNILCAVDEYCRENKIDYFIYYGTLLGAVRHKGYIPWDDDIDIAMFRKDYEIFIKNFNKSRNDQFQVLHSSIDKKFPYEFAKIHDKNTKIIENSAVKYEIGINIDLFVLDNFPTVKSAERQYKKSFMARKILECKHICLRSSDNFFKKIAKVVLHFFANICSIYSCTNKINRIARRYEHSAPPPLLCADVCQRWFLKENVLHKSWFNSIIYIEFEGKKFPAPKHYDKVLNSIYGLYMKLPPLEEQRSHHDYHAYIK